MSRTVTFVRSVALVGLAIVFVAAVWWRTDGGTAAGSVGAASTLAFAPSPSPVGTIGASPSVAASPSPVASIACGSEVLIIDGVLPTIKNLTIQSQVIAIGTVEAIGTASWNTATGAAPPIGVDGHPASGFAIYRPITISVATPIKGSTATTLNARLIGGSIGCYSVKLSSGPDPVVGGRYAFFLDVSAGPATEPTVGEAWPVTADGRIKTAYDGMVTTAALIKAIDAAP
jgi:hypothetical protein